MVHSVCFVLRGLNRQFVLEANATWPFHDKRSVMISDNFLSLELREQQLEHWRNHDNENLRHDRSWPHVAKVLKTAGNF